MTKILLVEDDKSLREIYGTRLLAENFDIVSAGDGEEALAMAIKEKPDMIISDVMMPKISGFDMLDILRSTTETRDIKVIMMTALSSEDQRIRGEQLGADKYLVKSQVGIEDVVAAVHQVLGDGGAVAQPVTTPAADASAPAGDASVATPAVDDVATVTPGVTTPADDTGAIPESDPVTASGSAPGNDAAGPLPPQPSELKPLEAPAEPESALPQPTAPFSSPRPTNLGEDIVHPSDDTAAPAVTDTLPGAVMPDLSASTDPVTPDVSAPLDAPAELEVVEPPTAAGLGFDMPAATPIEVTPAGEPAVTPLDTPAPDAPSDLGAPADEKKDDSATPSVPPTTPAV